MKFPRFLSSLFTFRRISISPPTRFDVLDVTSIPQPIRRRNAAQHEAHLMRFAKKCKLWHEQQRGKRTRREKLARLQWSQTTANIAALERRKERIANRVSLKLISDDLRAVVVERHNRLILALKALLGTLTATCLLTGCGATAGLSLDPLDGVCYRQGEFAVCGNPLTGVATLRSTIKGHAVKLVYRKDTGDLRGTMPDGTTAIYRDGKLTFEPALPDSGKTPVTAAP